MSTAKPLKISIVTPSFNQAQYLERTIQSILDQGYENLEYIIIDGGSTDGSVDIIKKYADRLAYWVSEKDKGQTHAINKGFAKATGDIVAYINSDDLYLSHSFETVAQVFAEKEDVDLVFGNTFLIDKDDNVLRDMSNVPFWWPAQIVVGTILPQPAAFWRHNLFDRYGYLDESRRFSMDYEFFCRIGRHAKVKHVRKNLACFRLHFEQKTETIQSIGRAERAEVRQKYLKDACGIWPPFVIKLVFIAYKTAWHILHGEFRYALRGLFRRSRIAAGKDVSVLANSPNRKPASVDPK